MEPQQLRTGRPPVTSGEYAYHELRTQILTGRIAAGERIVQSELADQLGVSVTPVREAMRRLQSEGLVELLPHRGATVRRLEFKEAQEIYQLRAQLEPLAIERSLDGLTSTHIAELELLCANMDDTNNVSEFAELNQRFHDLLLALDDASWLARIVQMLRMASSPYVALSLHANPTLMTTSNNEHRQMVHALAQHDIPRLTQIVTDHLEATVTTLANHLD